MLDEAKLLWLKNNLGYVPKENIGNEHADKQLKFTEQVFKSIEKTRTSDNHEDRVALLRLVKGLQGKINTFAKRASPDQYKQVHDKLASIQLLMVERKYKQAGTIVTEIESYIEQQTLLLDKRDELETRRLDLVNLVGELEHRATIIQLGELKTLFAPVEGQITDGKLDDAEAALEGTASKHTEILKVVLAEEAEAARKLKVVTLTALKLELDTLVKKYKPIYDAAIPPQLEDDTITGHIESITEACTETENPDPDPVRNRLASLEEEYLQLAEENVEIAKRKKRMPTLVQRYTTSLEGEPESGLWGMVKDAWSDVRDLHEDPTDEGWLDYNGYIEELNRSLDAFEGKQADTKKREALQEALRTRKELAKRQAGLKRHVTPENRITLTELNGNIDTLLKDKESLEELEETEVQGHFDDLEKLLDKIEEYRKTRSRESRLVDSGDGGHSVVRHGPEIMDETLQRRLTRGLAPDGVFSPTHTSSRFGSYDDWEESRNEAFTQAQADEGTDFGTNFDNPPPNGIGNDEYLIIQDHGKVIGDGFKGRPGTSYTATQGRKSGTAYTEFDPIPGMTKTMTRIRWVPEKTKWVVVQHYPIE